MTGIGQSAPSLSTDARTAGWIVSLILHGTLVFGAFLFLQHIKLAPQPDLFQWDVAMVSPAPQATTAPTRTTKQATPPTPAAESVAKPAPAKIESAVQPSEPAPSRPMAEPILSPVTKQSPLTRTTETTDHPVTHTEQTAAIPPPAAPLSQRAASTPVIEPSAPPSSSLRDSEQATATPHAPALDAPLLPTSTAPADPAPAARNETETVPTDNSLPTQVAALGPTGQTKSVKADYGWLSDLMAKWIGELDKRYPAMLRTEGVAGRVTLTALLHQNGTLTNVRVVKSSGNALLDQVAIEDITNGPPVKLSRPLDRPNMPVKFSIVYDLKTAR